jgi:alpha-D-xyloside xylohydrolase
LSIVGATPMKKAMAAISPAEPPFRAEHFQVETLTDGAVLLSHPLDDRERLYGTGLQFMRADQRGRTRYLRVNSDPKQDTGETHAPVPFYVSDRGYGVLIDTARIVTLHLGSTMRLDETNEGEIRDRNRDSGWKATLRSERAELRLPVGGADVYVFAGPTVADVVRRYNLFCGGGVLPPKWGLGFWHRVPTLYSQEDALQEALAYRENDYPCDVIGLEPGWHSRSYPVTNEWDRERFHDPAAFVSRMREEGFRVNLWEHPYLSPEGELHGKLLPLSGSHSVWGGIAPDYTLPEAQRLYKQQHLDAHIRIGVSGYKLDECDGSELTNNSWMFPAHAKFPSGLDGEQMRQLYGLLFQKMTTDVYREENRRTYGLVRASGAGASSLPYVLYSDLYDHKQFIRALVNASYCGLLWTPEVRRARSAEDWIRRMQTVVFSPLAMLNAWGDGTKPWSYPEAEPIIRRYLKLRMRLLPYLYTAFAAYRETGVPPVRPMSFVMSPEELTRAEKEAAVRAESLLNTTDAAYGKKSVPAWDDQYMFGEELLVAPLVEGETERDVLLPQGSWIGLETGIRYEGGRILRVAPGLERIPVFVREGAVIPMMPSTPHVPASSDKTELQLVHFGSLPGSCSIYDDDGETFNYERGENGWWRAIVEVDDKGTFHGRIEGEAEPFYSYDRIVWKLGHIPSAKP